MCHHKLGVLGAARWVSCLQSYQRYTDITLVHKLEESTTRLSRPSPPPRYPAQFLYPFELSTVSLHRLAVVMLHVLKLTYADVGVAGCKIAKQSTTVLSYPFPKHRQALGGMVTMQAAFKSITLRSCARAGPGVPFLTLTTVLLVAGAAILRWLAQSVESRGLGDGTSWLITLSIVTSELTLAAAFKKWGVRNIPSCSKCRALTHRCSC